MKNNIFVKNILDKLKNVFNNENKKNYSEVIISEKNEKESLNEFENVVESKKEEIENNVIYNNMNLKLLTIDECVKFIKEECKDKMDLLHIYLDVWYKFNKYPLSKFTRDRLEEYEDILCQAIQNMQNYFNEENISWFKEAGNYKELISNDISFIIRYSENLIRIKYENRRMLSYQKFKDIDKLEKYLDNKFKNIINTRIHEISSTIPDSLFDLDIEDIIINEDTFDIESMNKARDTSKIEQVLINKEKNIKVEDIFVDSKELDSILNDIDGFEI